MERVGEGRSLRVCSFSIRPISTTVTYGPFRTVARTCNLIFIVLDVLKPLGDKAVRCSPSPTSDSPSHSILFPRSSKPSLKDLVSASTRLLPISRSTRRSEEESPFPILFLLPRLNPRRLKPSCPSTRSTMPMSCSGVTLLLTNSSMSSREGGCTFLAYTS